MVNGGTDGSWLLGCILSPEIYHMNQFTYWSYWEMLKNRCATDWLSFVQVKNDMAVEQKYESESRFQKPPLENSTCTEPSAEAAFGYRCTM